MHAWSSSFRKLSTEIDETGPKGSFSAAERSLPVNTNYRLLVDNFLSTIENAASSKESRERQPPTPHENKFYF
jgi:hypothetical protein